MRFNALLVAGCLLAFGGLAALRPVHEAAGLALDHRWQLAIIHAELVLAPLLYLPLVGDRAKALSNLATGFACWAAGGAVVLLFSFASLGDQGLQTRGLSAVVWLAAGGLLALGARGGSAWVARARIALLCMFGLPPLWHYLTLEYSGASTGHLKALSPNWGLATGDASLWALLTLGLVAWGVAIGLPKRRQA